MGLSSCRNNYEIFTLESSCYHAIDSGTGITFFFEFASPEHEGACNSVLRVGVVVLRRVRPDPDLFLQHYACVYHMCTVFASMHVCIIYVHVFRSKDHD